MSDTSMEQISAREFFLKFKSTMEDNKELVKVKYNGALKAWTNTIKELVEGMMDNTQKSISREYYRTDSLGWQQTFQNISLHYDENYKIHLDDKHYLKLHGWKNKYAVEYENNPNEWTDELVKLSHIRSDLKIIISYSQYDNYDDYKKLIDEKLKVAIEILRISESVSLDDQWLIIFGPCSGNYDINNIVNDFVGYTLTKEGNEYHFMEINERRTNYDKI